MSPIDTPRPMRIGFAGSRRLSSPTLPELTQSQIEESIQHHLEALLGQVLPRELGLTSMPAFQAISQIAIGADAVFTQACATLKIPQEIFLPQELEAYLAAKGSQGLPDFTPSEQHRARALLADAHIVRVVTVTSSADRTQRFTEVTREIVRASDVCLCLLGVEASLQASGLPGGTHEMAAFAIREGKPTWVVRVGLKNGAAVFTDQRCQ